MADLLNDFLIKRISRFPGGGIIGAGRDVKNNS